MYVVSHDFEHKNWQCPKVGRRSGFTLIELLVVVAIIGVLAGLSVPVVSSVLSKSKDAAGLSNLRQVSIAVQLFIPDYSNKFPPAASPTTNYAVILTPYLGGEGATYSENVKVPDVFKDPAAASDEGSYHFSCNPNFMPDIQQWSGDEASRPSDEARLISVFMATRPTEQVLIADGAQVFSNGNSMATFYAAQNVWKKYPHTTSDDPVDAIVNEDNTQSARGQLRWRAAGGKGIKCLFVSGNAEILRQGELLQRQLQIDNY